MQTLDAWIAHASTLPTVALCVLEAAVDVPVTERQFHDRKVLALALLSRTYNTFRAILVLAPGDFVPETRMLVRSCFENLFLTASLLEKGEAFVEEMVRDEQMGHVGQAKVLYQGQRARVGDADPLVKQLKERIDWMMNREPKPAFIHLGEAAAGTSIAHTYLVYRKLSADAAHPSITALKRHLNISAENGVRILSLDAHPSPRAVSCRSESVGVAV